MWGVRWHRHVGDATVLPALLTLDDVDRLLTASALRAPAVRLVQDGWVVPRDRVTRSASIAGLPLTGLLDPQAALRLFDEGATVVLQGLHRYHPPLSDLVADLELELGHPCQANAYLTPAGAQGFARHSDTHDVFVVQTAGTKQWQIWDAADAQRPAVDVVFRPGVSEYLPAGTPHAARAQETVSLHVTIGVNQISWGQLLDRAIRQAGESDPQLPRTDRLPTGYLDDPNSLVDALAVRVAALAKTLAEQDAQRLADEHIRRFLTSRLPRLRGALRDRLRLDRLADDTPLRRRPGRPLAIVAEGDKIALLVGDRTLRVPARIRPAVEAVAAAERLTPADLAGWLDGTGRLVLCRRLIREGVLELIE
ncbi:MAG: JmjC domain-containing protein [Dermatophilaceae bacterium]